jgi:hypothetical protein
MEGGAHPATRFCGLHTIAELERLLGFGAGARVIARAVENCHRSPGRCASHYACAERLAAMGGPQAKLATLTRGPAAAATAAPAAPRRSATVVQLHGSAPALTATDDAGNFIERRSVRTDVVLARGDNIADLLSYWTALKGEDRVPRFADLDPVRLAQLGLLGRLHVLNAENADPSRMRFDLYGNKVPLDNGRIYTGLAIGDHPVRIQAQTVAADYDTVRRTAEPHYFRVWKRLGGIGYRYARLILPFSAGEGRVDRLIVAVRPEPDDGLPLDR